jgi:hypothetical protein
MKLFYSFCLSFIVTLAAQAQKINYESSKWFWGANIGATWQSTDVKSESYNGWGLTLGRSFNYDYGHALSFDIRGRFLNGQWYGQATDFSTLNTNSNSVLQSYLTGDNQYVHNFRTDARELDLELVLHAARLRERTGLDPYIFGGLGLTWQQNWADVFDTNGIYDYNGMALNGPLDQQLVGVLDNIYETRLDGLTNNEWQVNWMPSLGIGLAYHRGRVSFGLEHKTTFTRADSFDGLANQSLRLRNDWYHYTSAILQIHFKGRSHRPLPEQNPTPNTPPVVPAPVPSNPAPNPTPVPTPVPNPTPTPTPNPVQNCPKPEVSAFFPPQGTVQSTTQKLEFVVHFINSSQDIKLYNGQNQLLPFNYNSYSARVEAIVNLVPGINNFTLVATTNCGTDQQTVQVVRENCQTPTIQVQNNTVNNSVNQASYNLVATISGQLSAANIQLLQNGMAVNGFNYNPATGQLQRQLNLAPGLNQIRIEANSNCGNANEQLNINFNNCELPQLTILNPSASGSTTNQGTLAFKAKISGTITGGQAQLYLNNQLLPTPQISGNLILASIPLVPGNNTILVKFTNNCGTDQESTSINFQNCVAPVISVLSPTMNSTVQNAALRLRANLLHVSNIALVKVVLNGIEQTSFTFNSTTGLLEFNGQLNEGSNNFTITAANDCGSDIETFTLTYEACKKPTIAIINAPANGTIVNQAAFNFSAQTTFLNQNQVSISLNGVIGQPFTLQNNLVSAALNLRPGLNTILIQGKNDCDRTSQTLSLTYTPAPTPPPCVAPSVNITNPAAGLFGVSNPAVQISAIVSNMPSTNGVSVRLNGQLQSNFTLNGTNLNAALQLNSGINTIKVKAENACGQAEAEREIRYEPCDPPQVIYNMIPSGGTVNNPVFTYYATVVNYTVNSNIVLSINGTVLSGYSNVNGSLAAELGLIEGANQITITVTNDCGTFSNTYNVTYVNDGSEGLQKKPSTTTKTNPTKPTQTTPVKKPTPAPTPPVTPVPGNKENRTEKGGGR